MDGIIATKKEPSRPPLSAWTWMTSLGVGFADRGHNAYCIQIETDDFVQSYFCNNNPIVVSSRPNYQLIYTGEIQTVRQYIELADAIVIRHHHEKYSEIFSSIDLNLKPVAQIIAASPVYKLDFVPPVGW